MSHDDSSLVSKALQGDQAAFVALYERHHPSIFTYIFYRVGDQKQAEDLTAEVFVRLVEKLDTFVQRDRPILAWLYTIARNLLIDHYRRTSQATLMPLEEGLTDEDSHPARSAERRLTQAALSAALRDLTEEQRQVILLKFVEGRSNAEVAALLGKNNGAVKSLQHRALASLRRVLEENGYDTL